jgi:hypothetical protein
LFGEPEENYKNLMDEMQMPVELKSSAYCHILVVVV